MPAGTMDRRTWFQRMAAGMVGALLVRGGASGCSSSGPMMVGSDDASLYRYFLSDGIPDHEMGVFPNPGCPFPVLRQDIRYRMLLQPEPSPALTPLGYWVMGVALNGVPFDPSGPGYYLDGVADPDWSFEVTSPVARPHLGLDTSDAHSQPGGAYHYHGYAPSLRTAADRRAEHGAMSLVGWAADGFPIYAGHGPTDPWDLASPLARLRSGYALLETLRNGGPGGRCDGTFVQDYAYDAERGDLDEANGRAGVTPDFPEGTYYYVLTETFPYIPRFFRGAPDPTFGMHSRGPGLMGVPLALRDYRG